MGGTRWSARTALRVVLVALACLAPPCTGVWAQRFRTAQSVEPPLVGAPPIITEGPDRFFEPADPPTPTVRLHVRAPAAAASGQEVDYHILVENPSRAAANHVQVRVPPPANADFLLRLARTVGANRSSCGTSAPCRPPRRRKSC